MQQTVGGDVQGRIIRSWLWLLAAGLFMLSGCQGQGWSAGPDWSRNNAAMQNHDLELDRGGFPSSLSH